MLHAKSVTLTLIQGQPKVGKKSEMTRDFTLFDLIYLVKYKGSRSFKMLPPTFKN